MYVTLSLTRTLSLSLTSQLASEGTPEGVWLWVCASGDRRVSVWSEGCGEDVCHLVDWLSFPGPPSAPNGSRITQVCYQIQWKPSLPDL